MQDDNFRSRYQTSQASSGNVIPGQTFAAQDGSASESYLAGDSQKVEQMLRKVGHEEELSAEAHFEPPQSSSRLWGRSLGKVFAISAILVVLVFGVAAVAVLRGTRDNTGKDDASISGSPAIKGLGSDKNGQQLIINNSLLKINRNTQISEGKTFITTGDVLVQSSVNSANAFKIQNAAGSNLLVADTEKGSVTINGQLVNTGGVKVSGDVSASGAIISTTGAYSLNSQGLSLGGVLVCTSAGCKTTTTNQLDTSSFARLAASQTFSGVNKFTAAGNIFTGDGSGLSALSAGNVSSGTLSDARLSNNVALLASNQTFSGSKTFSSQLQAAAGVNSITGFSFNGTAGAGITCAPGELLQQAIVQGGIITSGLCVPGAGASIATLQEVYDASSPANIVLSNISGKMQIQDAASPLAGNLFEVTSNGAVTTYFAVNNLGISVTGNINTTGQYQVGGFQISSANLSNDANLAKVNGNTTFTGSNTFSNAGNSFTGNGSGLTSLNASNVSSGTLNDARLSNNVALLNALQTFTGVNTFSNASNSFTGNGSGLTSLNATNVSSGTLNDARLSANVALLNANQTFTAINTFNNAGNSFTGNGSGLTSLNASNLSSGTVNDARLSANVTLQGNTFNGNNQLVQLTAGGILPILNGSNLTALNASNVSSGTLSDSRLSANVALLNANNIFLGNNSFHLNSTALSVQDASSPLGADLFTVTNFGGGTKYFSVSATGAKVNGNDICTTIGNCTGVAGGSVGGSGTAGTLSVFTGTGFTIGDSLLSQSGGTVTVNGNISLTAGNNYQVNGSQISSANLSNDANLAKLSANQTFSGNNTFSSASNSFTGSGAGLTSLNASNLSSGTVNDGRLSANVALLNANNTFTGNNEFTGTVLSHNTSTTALQVQDASNFNVLTVDTQNKKVIVNEVNFGTAGNASQIITKDMAVTAAVNAHDVVIIDTANAGQVTTTATGNSNLVYGVATATKSAGLTQGIVIAGTYQVNVDATSTIAIGDFIATSATTGKVTTNNNPAAGTILGRALSAIGVAGAGQMVWVQVTPDVGGGSAGSGVTAIGTIDTQTKSADGAVIVGTSLYLQTADAGAPGLISTGAQTISGNKTFNNTVNATTLQEGGVGVLLQNSSFSGDISGAYNATTLAKIAGTTLTVSSLSSGQFLQYNGTAWVNQTITGDITINNSGVSAIGVGKVATGNILDGTILDADISGSANISDSKLNTISSAGKVADSALSSNVALKNANNTFTGNDVFSLNTAGLAVQDAASPLGTDLFKVTDSSGLTKYFTVSATALQFLGNDVCTTAGNCAGVGGGVTTAGGTAGKIAKFTSGSAIGDSLLSESGSIVTVGGTLAVNTITPTATLTVGTPTQTLTLQGDASTKLTAKSGSITNSLVFAAPSGTNKTITIPNATGTVAVSASGPLSLDAAGNLTCPTCLTSGGGGGTSGVVDINSLTGSITLAGTANQITITPAGNTLTFSTPQDINTSSSVDFANVNVSGQFKVGGSQISSANLSNDANLAKLNGTQTFTGDNTFSSASNSFTGIGSGLTSLNASNLSSGTVNDARLSSNVALKNGANVFTNTNSVQTTSATSFQLQSASAAETLLTADTTARSASGGNLVKIGNSTGTDGATTILIVDSASSAPTSNLGVLNGGLFYNSGNNHLNVIENGVVKELCNKTDLGCGSAGVTQTLATIYANGSSQTDETILLDATRNGVLIRDNATPITGTLFGIQNSTGATKYLDVTTSGISVSGAVTASGNINTTGGVIQTNSVTRIDNSGNLTNIGTINGNTFTNNSLVFSAAGAASIDAASGQNLNLGTGASNHTTTLGSTNGTASTVVQSGSGGVSLAGNTTVAGTATFSVAGGLTSLGANLDVNNSVAYKHGTDVSTTGSLDDFNFGNASLIRLTGASTQTITGLVNSGGNRDGELLTIINAAGQAAIITDNDATSVTAGNRIRTGTGGSISLATNSSINLVYDSQASRWRVVGDVGGGAGAGVTSVGTFASCTSYANGAQISSNTITFSCADITNPGMVSTGAQTFLGTKQFNSLVTANAGLTVTAGQTLTVNGDGFTDLTGDGLKIATGTLTVQVAASANGLSATTSSGSGLEVLSSGVTLLQGCADGEILKWNETTDVWACGTDVGSGGLGDSISVNGSAATDANFIDTTVSGSQAGVTITLNTGPSPDTIAITVSNASVSDAGVVTTGTQSFAGDKTFTGNLAQTGSTTFSTGTGNVSLNGDTTLASGKNFTQSGGGTFSTGSGLNTLNGNTTVAGTATFSVAGGLTSLGADLDVTGSVAYKHGVDVSTTPTLADLNVGDVSLIRLTGASTQTLNSIAGGRDGYLLTIVNAASQSAVIADETGATATNRIRTGTGGNISLGVNSSITLVYDSQATRWRVVGDVAGGAGAGVTSIGTYNNCTSYANGAQISSGVLTFSCASITQPGLVDTGTQTFGGAKTFNSLLTGAAGLTVTGGAVSLTGNTNSSLTTTSGTLSLQGFGTTSLSSTNRSGAATSDININTGNVTSGVFSSGSINIDVGTSTGTNGTISIGSNASALALGNIAGSAQTIIQSGSGGISLSGNTTVATNKSFTANGTAAFAGATNSATAFLIQNATSADTLLRADTTARSGSGGNLVKIGNSTGTDGNTTILVLDSSTSVTSNLSALNGGLFYDSGTNHVNVIENGAVKELCNKTDLGCGSAVQPTLAQVYGYGASAGDQTLALTSADGGGVILKDAASTVGSLFTVQDNTATTNYLNVTNSGVSVGGAISATGNINTTAGVLQTNSVTRIDNSGNLSNIGNISLSGAISGGTTYSGSGNINTTGGVIQTNSTTRIDNSGNLSNIGNIGLSGSVSGGTTYSGSGNINSTGGSLQTNSVSRVDNSGNLTNIGNFTATAGSTFATTGANGFVFKPGTNNTTAFQVQNAAGDQSLINVDTTNTNLVANSSFELNSTTGWQNTGFGTTSYSQNTSNAYIGKASLQAVLPATAGGGAAYNFTQSNGITYTALVYVKASGAGFSTLDLGHSNTGAGDVTCLTSQTITTTSWTKLTCSWVASSPTGGGYFYVSHSDGSTHTIFIDAVQIYASNSVTIYQPGAVNISGVISSPAVFQNSNDSNTAFQIQNAAGTEMLVNVDTSLRSAAGGNLVKIGNSTGTDTNTTVLVVDSNLGVLTSNLSALNGGIYYNSSTNHINVIENGAVKELCNKTDLGCSSAANPTLATTYANGASQTDSTITLDTTRKGVIIQDAASPIGTSLFNIQANGTGSTPYLSVSSTNVAINDNADITGYLNTPYGGLGTYSNLLKQSEAFDLVGGAPWTVTNVTAPTTNTVVAPDGNTSAESLADSASGGFESQAFTTSTTGNYTFSVWLKAASTQSADLRIDSTGTNAQTGTVKTVSVTTSWQRFFVTQNITGPTITSVVAFIFPGGTGGSGTVSAWGAQLVSGTSPQVYIHTVASNISTSSAGLTVSGSSSFSPVNDSTTAFQVQNAAGTSLLTVDTTNSRILVPGANIVQSPLNPVYKGGADADFQDGFTQVAVVGNYLYGTRGGDSSACTVTGGGCELAIYDISNPTSPVEIGAADSTTGTGTDTFNAIAVAGKYAYIAKNSNAGTCSSSVRTGCELQIYDISNPANPTYVGGADDGNDVTNGIVVSGNYVYMVKNANPGTCSSTVNTGCEIQAYNVSNPANPTYTGGSDAGSNVNVVNDAVNGRYLYIARVGATGTCSSGNSTGCELQIFDLATPGTPTYVGGGDDASTALDASSIYVSGRYAYLSKTGNSGTCSAGTKDGCELQIWDISNPTSPTFVNGIDSINAGNGTNSMHVISVSGNYAYVTKDGNSGTCSSTTKDGCELQVYDISTPSSIVYKGGVDNGGTTDNNSQVVVKGHYAYVGKGSNAGTCSSSVSTGCELQVYDISGLEVTGINAGSLYSGNAQIQDALMVGNQLSVGGNADFAQNVKVSGNLGVSGYAQFQNSANSTIAFQIQNATGGSLLNVDSTNAGAITVLGNASGEVGTWAASTSLAGSGLKDGGVIVTSNGYVYAIGGNSTAATRNVQYAKLNANGTIGTWTDQTTTNQLPAARLYAGGTAANGYVYVIGGSTSTSATNMTSTVYYAKQSVDGSLGAWGTALSLPAPRSPQVVTAYGYIYAIGGQDTSGATQTTTYFAKLNADGSVGTWNTTGVIPAQRSGGATAVANGYIYYVGGLSSGTTTNNNVYYGLINPLTGAVSWSTGTNTGLPTSGTGGLEGAAATVINGHLYVVGGDNTNTSAGAQNNIYYTTLSSTGNVSAWTANTSTLGSKRTDEGVIAANGYIYAIGGVNQAGTILGSTEYASAARLSLGGSLDLVGLSGQTLTEGGSGGSLTAGNTNIVGTLNVMDQVNFNNSLAVGGNLNVQGYGLFQNSSNSTTAFQIQNAAGTNLLRGDTSNLTLTTGGNILPSLAGSVSSVTTAVTSAVTGAGEGAFTATAVGTDSMPVVAYYTITDNTTASALKFAHCSVRDCSSSTTTTLDTTLGNFDSNGATANIVPIDTQISMKIGSDGLPIVSYYDKVNTALKVTHCGNITCTSGNVTTQVDNAEDDGWYNSMAIGRDGLPVIAEYDNTNSALKVAKCTNITCSSAATITTLLNNAADVGNFPSIAIGTDGFPVIAWWQASSFNSLEVSHCTNVSCSTFDAAVVVDNNSGVDAPGNGKYAALAIGADGFPIIAYSYTNINLKVAHCSTVNCSSSTFGIPTGSVANEGNYNSITIGADGLAIIATDGGANDADINHCSNIACTAVTNSSPDGGAEDTGRYGSLVIGSDGLPIYTYMKCKNTGGTPCDSNAALRIAHCGNTITCYTASTSNTFAGGINLGSAGVGLQNAYINNLFTTDAINPFTINTNGITRLKIDASGNSLFSGSLSAGSLAGGTTIGLLAAPISAPTVTPVGTAGATTYTYTITTVSANGGESTASTAGSTTTGNAALNTTNYNSITWPVVSGAASYRIYRTVGITPGLIGTSTTTNFNDTGLAGSGASPTINTTGSFTVNGNNSLIKNTTDNTTAFQIQNASGTSLLTADTTNFQILLNGDNLVQTFSTLTYKGGADAWSQANGDTGNGIEYGQFVQGRYLYVVKQADAGSCSGTVDNAIGCELQIYDVSTPGAPAYVGGADATGTTNGGSGNSTFGGIYVSGKYAYIIKNGDPTACSQTAGSAVGCELQIYDVSNPSTPTYVGGADAGGAANSGTQNSTFTGISVSGKYIYITKNGDATACSQTAGSAVGCELQVYDATNPANPTYIGGADASASTNTGTSNVAVNAIAVSGRYAYLTLPSAAGCSGTAGSAVGCELQVYDLSNPAAPTYKGGADASGTTNGGTATTLSFNKVAVSGRYVYVATNGNATACAQTVTNAIGCELQVYDISNPTTPTYKGGSDITGSSTGTTSAPVVNITVAGRYAYLTKGLNNTACSSTAGSAIGCELQVYDVVAPATPTYKGGADASGNSNSGTSNAVDFTSAFVAGHYIYVGTSGTSGTACSQTVGSAAGCELQVYDQSGIEATSLLAQSIEAGTLQVAADASVSNNLAVGGGITVGQSAQISGNLGVNGSAAFQNSTNSTTAFQVQNSTGGSLINVDTTNTAISLFGSNTGNTSAWGTTTVLPAASSRGASVVVNGYLYYLGGRNAANSAAVTTIYYGKLNNDGTINGAWQTNTSNPLPVTLQDFTAFTSNGYIYVLGGNNNTTTLTGVYSAKVNSDGTTGAWTTLNSLPSARDADGTAISNGYVYVIGGTNGTTAQSSVFYAKINPDGTLGTWQTNSATGLPTRMNEGAVAANGYLYVTGGLDAVAGTSQANTYYAKINADGSTNNWTLSSNVYPSSSTRNSHATYVSGGYIYVAGGVQGSSRTEVFYAPITSSGDIGAWVQSTNSLTAGRDSMAFAVANGYILYVLGGGAGVNATVQYAYTPRIQALGALDLVGSGNPTGGSLTAGNTSVQGSLQVTNSTVLGDSLQVAGSVILAGSNSQAAFQVQSSNTVPIVDISNISTNQNFISNPSFESNINGWTNLSGSATVFATSATNPQSGTQSLQVTAAASVLRGAQYNYFFKPNTTYTYSVYTSLSTNNSGVTSAAAKFDIGANVNTADVTCTGNGNNLTFTTTVTRWTCSFTTGNTTTPSDYVYVRRQASDANIRSIHIDAAQLEAAASATSFVDQPYSNLISNSSLETNTNGWSAKGAATGSGSSTFAQFGNQSYKSVTTAATTDGAQYRYGLQPSSRYTLSLYAKADSSINAILGRQENGSDVETSCSGFTISTSWAQYTCTFTTGTTIGAAPNIYLRQTTAAIHSIYIDGVTLVPSGIAQAFTQPAGSLQADPLYGNLSLNASNIGEIQPWQSTNQALVNTRYGFGSAVANGYIYVIGGSQFGVTQTSVYYAKLNADGSTGAWQTNAQSLPTPLENLSAVVANGYVYAIGGNDGPGSAAIYVAKLNADGSTGAWTTNAANNLPSARYNHTSVVYNGYVYVVGGYATGGTPQGSIYYAKLNADGTLGTWFTTTVGATINAANQHASVTANGYLYIISGNQNFIGTTNVYYSRLSSDGSLGTFTLSPYTVPVERDFASAVVSNGYVYLVGGSVGGTPQSSVYFAKLNADGSTGAWQTSANALPQGLYRQGSAIVNGYIYSIGGIDTGSNAVNNVYYTSTSRILVSGSLDLVGLSGQNLTDAGESGQGSTGGSLTAGNTIIVGSLQVESAANFAQSVAVAGNLNVGGTAQFQSALDTSTAFLVQDSQSVNYIQLNSTSSTLTLGATTGKSVSYNTHGNGTPATGLSAVTSGFTVSGSNPTVIVSVALNSATATVSNVTWSAGGGTAYEVKNQRSGSQFVSMWAVPAPTAGTGTVTATISASVPYQIDAQVFNNADQTTPAAVGDAVSTSGVDVTSLNLTANNLTSIDATVVAGGNGGTGGDPSGITPITTFSNNTTNTNLQTGYKLGTGQVTGNWTSPISSNEILVAVRVKRTTTGPSTVIQGGTGGITLNPLGTNNTGVLVKPLNDSTAAFQIQNAAGTSLFMADTLNGQITHARSVFSGNILPSTAASISNTSTVITAADSGASVGKGTSTAIGVDGLPVVMYVNASATSSIKFLHCSNSTCSTSTTATVDSSIGNYGTPTLVLSSLKIGADGLPVMSYYDQTNTALKVTHCGNYTCTSGNVTTQVDNAEDDGLFSSIAIGRDGFPVVAYYNNTVGDLKFVHCTNVSCTTSTAASTPYSNAADVGNTPSITIGTDGFPIIASWHASGTIGLDITHCGNITCTSGNATTVGDNVTTAQAGLGEYPSITIGSDGLPVVAYWDGNPGTTARALVVHCTNVSCSSSAINTPTANASGKFNSINIGTDGLPVITTQDPSTNNGDPVYIHCTTLTCSASTSADKPETTNDIGNYGSSIIAPDGLVFWAYFNATSTNSLRVVKCASTINCAAATTSTALSGGINLGSAGVGLQNAYINNIFTTDAINPFNISVNNANRISINPNGTTTFTGSTIFKPFSGGDSTTAFQIQNSAGTSNLLTIDTSGSIITFAGNSTTFANITLTNAHFKVTQTNVPTIGTPTNCGGGTGPTATVTANSTDSAGSFTINAGSTGSPTTCDTIFTFNKAYSAAPKSIILTATTATGGNKYIYVSASSTTTFTVKFGTGSTAPANSEANTFNYWVVE